MENKTVDQILAQTLDLSRMLRQKCFQRDEKDVNMLQLHAVVLIREHEGMTMKEFAESLKITSPSATSFVNRVVNMGWVQRVADKKNRKLVRLKITPLGKRLLQARMQEKRRCFRDMLKLLSVQDQRDLVRVLQKLTKALASCAS
jgi:DNA-binding MarR family transcriptional regulator